MRPTLAQVRCPRCSAPIQAAIDQVIDVSQDPGSKARLLSGSMNLVRCSACGYEGALATPIVYHDAGKELLLTFFPFELGTPKNEQERLLGQLINQVINRLPAEKRKGYLLQPQAVLTMQGLVDRILQADGITHEEIEAQRAKLRLFEDLLRVAEDQLERFVNEHDAALDETFFSLATLAMQGTKDPRAQQALARRIDSALVFSSLGKRLKAQEAELKNAAESLKAAEGGLTRERLLEMLLSAPNEDRVTALASLARPALDYAFFQLLTDRTEAASGVDKDKLSALRQRLLEITQEIDQAQQARVTQAAEVLKAIASAKDLDEAVRGSLPLIDEVFLGVLEANLRAATDRGDKATAQRLEQVSERIRAVVRESLPPGLRLAQQLLETREGSQGEALLDTAPPEALNDDLLRVLMGTAQRLQEDGDDAGAQRLRKLHRHALHLSMQAKIQRGAGSPQQPPPAPGQGTQAGT